MRCSILCMWIFDFLLCIWLDQCLFVLLLFWLGVRVFLFCFVCLYVFCTFWIYICLLQFGNVISEEILIKYSSLSFFSCILYGIHAFPIDAYFWIIIFYLNFSDFLCCSYLYVMYNIWWVILGWLHWELKADWLLALHSRILVIKHPCLDPCKASALPTVLRLNVEVFSLYYLASKGFEVEMFMKLWIKWQRISGQKILCGTLVENW